jgi:DNA-binding transcriptional LysR family regulator
MKAARLDRQPEPVKLPAAAGGASAIELRHLRYFVALADAGSFTRAAERIFIAQPTLSQQIRRLEEIVGAPLLHRRRDGVYLTKAGAVLLDASRAVLSLVDQEVNRTREAAGLGRQRLRVVVPPGLPDALAVEAASMLKSAAAAADVEIIWNETPLDTEFSMIRERRADAGLGWLTASP